MIYILNKNKLLSYVVASFIIIGLFAFSSSIVPNKDVEMIKVSSNVINEYKENNVVNMETQHKNITNLKK